MSVRGAASLEPDIVYAGKVLKKCIKTRDVHFFPAMMLLNMPWHLTEDRNLYLSMWKNNHNTLEHEKALEIANNMMGNPLDIKTLQGQVGENYGRPAFVYDNKVSGLSLSTM